MTVLQPLHHDRVSRRPLTGADAIALNPSTHGRGRVPGCPAPHFDFDAFTQALERRDTDYQLTCYAPDADIRIVDPDNPPPAPWLVQGSTAIRSWLVEGKARELDLHVIHRVDGGDRVAFTERWHYQDGVEGQGTSTAELRDGLITTQHTILVWGHSWS